MYLSLNAKMWLMILYLPPCLLLLFLVKKVQTSRGVVPRTIQITRVLLALFLFLVPTWQAILGKFYLDYYCRNDGGIFINSQERVDSVYFESNPNIHAARPHLARGFDYIEFGREKGEIARYSFNDEGEIVVESVSESTSDYEFDFFGPNIPVGPELVGISKSELFLRNRHTNEIVAGYREYEFVSDIEKIFSITGSTGSVKCRTTPRLSGNPQYEERAGFLDRVASKKTNLGEPSE